MEPLTENALAEALAAHGGSRDGMVIAVGDVTTEMRAFRILGSQDAVVWDPKLGHGGWEVRRGAA